MVPLIQSSCFSSCFHLALVWNPLFHPRPGSNSDGSGFLESFDEGCDTYTQMSRVTMLIIGPILIFFFVCLKGQIKGLLKMRIGDSASACSLLKGLPLTKTFDAC